MKLPRDVNADVLIKVFSQYGYSVTRQVGSHVRLTNNDNHHSITIPRHDPIKVGLLHSLIKEFCAVNDISMQEIINEL
jgi:predicted RNA binding protein YcfA (HicA-like mRNA interferase family)